MIPAGTNSKSKGRLVPTTASQEVKWLALLLKAINNNGGLLNSIEIAISGGSSSSVTPDHHNLQDTDTLTLTGATYKAISFQVISGTVDVSIAGGTAITYPAGSNINFGINYSPITTTIEFTMPGSGSNQTLIQTTI